MNPSLQSEAEITVVRPPVSFWKREPGLRETILIWAICAVVFIAVASAFRPYRSLVMDFGDTGAYVQIAEAIGSWNFSGIHVKQFWGVSYAVAVVYRLTGVSAATAILIVCSASSLLALVLAHRFWGGWVALFALTLNFDWWQRSLLGGSEPMFLALLFASFLLIRKERWLWAALLASLATVTRPLGIFLLVGIGVVLLFRRQWLRLALSTLIGVVVGTLYILPLKLYLHDPLATVHSYERVHPAATSSLFGIPFYAIIVATLRNRGPWTNFALTFGWILVVLAGGIAMAATRQFRVYARSHPSEAIFAGLYLVSIYCYNGEGYYWSRAEFPRFAIPILPFVFLALLPCLPRWLVNDRRVVWTLALVSSALASCSALGIQNVLARLRG